MNFPSKAQVERVRQTYPQGTRVELVSMHDPYTTLKPGDRGTVESVDDIATVHIKWDNGSSLGAAYGADVIRIVESIITDEVIAEIVKVQKSGLTNMCDMNGVQRVAYDMGLYALVNAITDDKTAVYHFIVYGRGGEQ